MSHQELQIDEIIINKRFDELTVAERKLIEDIASNASEFNDAKLMLVAIQKQINDIPTIEPNPATKTHLVNEFKKYRPIHSERRTGLVFLFPKDKPLLQKPGFQILAAAAIFVLIFTLFIPSKNLIKTHEKTALVTPSEDKNPTKKSEEKVVEETISKNDIAPENKVLSEDDVKNNDVLVENNEKNVQNLDEMSSNMFAPADKETKDDMVDIGVVKQKQKKENELAKVSAPVPTVSNDAKLSDGIFNNSENESATLTTSSRENAASNASILEASAVKAEVASKKLTNRSTVKLSKSLADNAELIGYFYTSM